MSRKPPSNCPKCAKATMQQQLGTYELHGPKAFVSGGVASTVQPPQPINVDVQICSECGYVEMYKV